MHANRLQHPMLSNEAEASLMSQGVAQLKIPMPHIIQRHLK